MALACALSVAAAVPAQAQLIRHVSLGGGGASTRLRATTGTQSGTISGITAVGTGHLTLGRFALLGSYRQGNLKPDTGGGATQALVEARLMLAIRPVPWAEVAVGPLLRSYVASGSTENMTLITARVRAEPALLTDVLRSHIDLWQAVSTSTNVPGATGSGRGGGAGLIFRPSRSPLWIHLAYSIDRVELKGAGRIETLEDLSLTLGWGKL